MIKKDTLIRLQINVSFSLTELVVKVFTYNVGIYIFFELGFNWQQDSLCRQVNNNNRQNSEHYYSILSTMIAVLI